MNLLVYILIANVSLQIVGESPTRFLLTPASA